MGDVDEPTGRLRMDRDQRTSEDHVTQDDDVLRQHLEPLADSFASEDEGDDEGSNKIRGANSQSDGESSQPAGGDGETDDSDDEVDDIGGSVLRYARRCISTGEFSQAIGALSKVLEVCDFGSVASRQVRFCCVQLLSLTNQFDAALHCMMELYQEMPPPYATEDAMLVLAEMYESQGLHRFSDFWYKKIFASWPSEPSTVLRQWQTLTHVSFTQQDYMLTVKAGQQVLRLLRPRELTFEFVFQYVTALASFQVPRPGYQQQRQVEIFELLGTVMLYHGEMPLYERVRDPYYILLRNLCAAGSPAIYGWLFSDEDVLVTRISSAWKAFEARRQRKLALEERERAKQLMRQKSTSPKKPRRSRQRSRPDPTAVDVAAIRMRTKARAQSLRVSPPQKRRESTQNKSPKKPSLPTISSQAENCDKSKVQVEIEELRRRRKMTLDGIENSPTRRKLQSVRHLRKKPTLDDLVDERPNSSRSERSPSDTEVSSLRSSLLDVYTIPPVIQDKITFTESIGRTPGPADLDLDQLQEFARMVHYRSRVLRNSQLALTDLQAQRVTPEWLSRFDSILAFISNHQQKRRAGIPQHEFFSSIHARVAFQLDKIQKDYVQQYGQTLFSECLSQCHSILTHWRFENVDHVVERLQAARAIGIDEEKQRNLEFFHVHGPANKVG